MLTPRWEPLRHHNEQQRCYWSPHRFTVLPAGRRSGKTELIGKRRLIRRALKGSKFQVPRYFVAAPTRDQAKSIYWDDLKKMIPRGYIVGSPRESSLSIKLVTGAEIHVLGMDRPERVEGPPWDGGVLDEYANMRPEVWSNHVRPALSDRQGWCDFVGVPEGRNHYFDLYNDARAQMAALGGESDWGAYHWVSADILPPEEIVAARRDMDELTFEQEFEASFVNFQGRAYYAFIEETHCAVFEYDPDENLIICFDFNVDPGTASIWQERDLPTGLAGSVCIGEVWIENNSTTPQVCQKIAEGWGSHQGQVSCYGDASGGARGTSQTEGSDWDIIHDRLDKVFGSARVAFNVPRGNPAERARINAMNSRLLTTDGSIRLMVDPVKAPHMVRDLEGVMRDGEGNVDKSRHRRDKLTHLSDGVGYYIVAEYPLDAEQRVSSVVATQIY